MSRRARATPEIRLSFRILELDPPGLTWEINTQEREPVSHAIQKPIKGNLERQNDQMGARDSIEWMSFNSRVRVVAHDAGHEHEKTTMGVTPPSR